MAEIKVRPLIEADFDTWKVLWRGYIEFYKASIPEEMYEITWKRLMDPNYNEHGLGALLDGKLEGITHYSFQNSTWAMTNYCYLEDLFVNPDVRGAGLGRALIDEVKNVAINAGSQRLYWNTDSTNSTARKLYDSYTLESGKVQYRIPL
jgi:GNAT superfamily N-acetyltransferase